MTASVDDALERLTRALPERDREVWESLRPPVTEEDLALLREAVGPHELPVDYVSLLRWADGQAGHHWQALDCGPLRCARETATWYRWFLEEVGPLEYCPIWLPLAVEGTGSRCSR